MEKWQAIIQKKINLVSHKLQKSTEKFYVFMALFTIIGVSFFGFSRNIFSDDSEAIDSGVGASSVIEIKGTKVELIKRSINLETGYGEVLIRVDEPLMTVGDEYEAIANEATIPKKIDTKLEKITDQYYLFTMDSIPKKWKQIVIDFGITSQEKPNLNATNSVDSDKIEQEKTNDTTEQKVFVFDYRKIKNNTQLKKMKHAKYVLEATNIEIQNVLSMIESNKKSMQKARINISLLEEKAKQLEMDKKYQTSTEIKKTEGQITSLENTIKSTRESIEKIMEQNEELQEKKDKLIEKNHDAEFENRADGE